MEAVSVLLIEVLSYRCVMYEGNHVSDKDLLFEGRSAFSGWPPNRRSLMSALGDCVITK
jgi:hypothetical protein